MSEAVVEHNRRRRMAELTKYSGASTTFMTNEEIEALDAQCSGKSRRKWPSAGAH